MYVLILWYHDRSGIQSIWGPYENEESAKHAMEVIADWPMHGAWETFPLRGFTVDTRA